MANNVERGKMDLVKGFFLKKEESGPGPTGQARPDGMRAGLRK